VKRVTLLAGLATARAAAAEPPQIAADPPAVVPAVPSQVVVDDPPASEPAAPPLLGFRISFGTLPIDHVRWATYSLAIGAEHPLFCHVRGFGEYEWLWLDRSSMHEHGEGQRIQIGLRHELLGHSWSMLRGFVDGEVGGGMALVSDNVASMRVLPDAFAGLRVGYDLLPHTERSQARTFQTEVLVRAIAIPDGIGWFAGLGMWWGG